LDEQGEEDDPDRKGISRSTVQFYNIACMLEPLLDRCLASSWVQEDGHLEKLSVLNLTPSSIIPMQGGAAHGLPRAVAVQASHAALASRPIPSLQGSSSAAQGSSSAESFGCAAMFPPAARLRPAHAQPALQSKDPAAAITT
jgi:hypothetical protein